MPKKINKILLLVVLFGIFCIVQKSEAANIYVDQVLTLDCTNGNYSMSSRNCSGLDGNAYNTIQEGLDNTGSGDSLYLRGGTYVVTTSLMIPATMNGTPDAWTTMSSYPGEWAVLDGQNNIDTVTDTHGHMLGFSAYSLGFYTRKYIAFERMEFMRADSPSASDGSGNSYPLWIEGGPFKIRYCYFHDNGITIDAGKNNSGCIVGHQWKNSVIEYCVFKDNYSLYQREVSPGVYTYSNYMCAFKNYSDYKSQYTTDPDSATAWSAQKNTYRYNYFDHNDIALGYKNVQFLSRDSSGTDVAYKDRGDEIHHNIIKNSTRKQYLWMDFLQVHNNIFEDNPDVMVTDITADSCREMFYTTIYNNVFSNTRFAIGKGKEYVLEGRSGYRAPDDYPDYHPHNYIYNNLFQNITGSREGLLNLGILYHSYATYESSIVPHMNWNTVDIERNLFYGYSPSQDTINVGMTSGYSTTEFSSNGWSSLNFATTTSGLHPADENYKVDGLFDLGSGYSIANGGIGGSHPYLQGVSIPSYLGAVNPNDDEWIDGMETMAFDPVAYFTSVQSGSDPGWVEGAVPGDQIAPNAPSGLVIS